MPDTLPETPVLVRVTSAETPLLEQIEQALTHPSPALHDLPALTDVVMGDPYLAEQLAMLRRTFELEPQPAPGLISRIRTRLAWWLCGPELQHINQSNAALLRVLDSLIVHLDEERTRRYRLEMLLANRPTRDDA